MPHHADIADVFFFNQFQNVTAADYAPTPDYRPETKFEARGKRLGHGVWDLVFKRIK